MLLSHPADASFPSDHVAAAVAIAIVVLSVRRRLGLLTLLIALAVGYARVFVGDHYPGDVIGGATVGLLAGVVMTTAPARSVIAKVDLQVARGAGRLLERPG